MANKRQSTFTGPKKELFFDYNKKNKKFWTNTIFIQCIHGNNGTMMAKDSQHLLVQTNILLFDYNNLKIK